MRLCLSGDPECSGIAPCEACDKAMLTRVLPLAMIGGGFNGNVQVAQGFFLSYKEAHERLQREVAEAMGSATEPPPPLPPAEPATAPEPTPEPEPEQTEPDTFTEQEIVEMGQVEDFVEETPEPKKKRKKALTPKAARALARRARDLKAEREVNKKEEEDHNG